LELVVQLGRGSHGRCEQTWGEPSFHAPLGSAEAAARHPIRLAEKLLLDIRKMWVVE